MLVLVLGPEIAAFRGPSWTGEVLAAARKEASRAMNEDEDDFGTRSAFRGFAHQRVNRLRKSRVG